MLLKKLVVVMGVAICCLMAQNARADDYAVDGSHSSMIFGISHLGYSTTYGRFNAVEGAFSFDKNNLRAAAFEISIDPASIDTNDKKRDEHLRSPDFFDVRQFPTITFKSTALSVTDKGSVLVGNLTMHGVTKQVTIPLTYHGEGKGPYGNHRCGFTSHFSVKRSEFGMKGMIPNIGDDVTITFSFEGIRKK